MEGAQELMAAPRIDARRLRLQRPGVWDLAPLVALVALAVGHQKLPSWQFTSPTHVTDVAAAIAVLYTVWLAAGAFVRRLGGFRASAAPILTVAVLTVFAWDLLTAKSKVLPAPFFPTLDKIIEAYVEDWHLLLTSILYSLRLLGVGYAIGATVGFVTGIAIGWSRRISYWLTPGMRLIGPVPATAWIPIAMVVFPTSFWASVFLLALSAWFPVAVMTSSGIANVPRSYFEVARSLGADERFLIRHVAIPAAFPVVFIGLFMGLAMSFLTLLVAEMLGVKAGLGWYMTWAQGWAQFGKVYASLIIIAVLFSSIIAALFKAKDHLLEWQKGLVRW